MKKITQIALTTVVGLSLFASLAAAQEVPDFSKLPTPDSAPTDPTALIIKITTIVKWLQYALFVAATILIVLAAFDYLFSKGDPEKVKDGQNALIYAIIALIIGVLAGGIPKIVGSILGVK